MLKLPENNPILRKSILFSLDIAKYTRRLREQKEFDLASQLFKSGTAIGANVNEAQSPQSRADFIHKMKIADKECRETAYWLLLCRLEANLPDPGSLPEQNMELLKILSKIISTSKR